MEEEAKYYCKKCDSEIKPINKTCPKCGSILADVGRRIEITLVEELKLSDEVKAELSKEQLNIIERGWDAIRNLFSSVEIDSITFGFPQFISVKIKKKKD